MSYTIFDLQPGTIWMQSETLSNLIIKIEAAPHCVVRNVYGRYGGEKQYTRDFPIMPGDPVIELAPYNRRAKVLTRYLICSSPKLMDTVTSREARLVLRYFRKIS